MKMFRNMCYMPLQYFLDTTGLKNNTFDLHIIHTHTHITLKLQNQLFYGWALMNFK